MGATFKKESFLRLCQRCPLNILSSFGVLRPDTLECINIYLLWSVYTSHLSHFFPLFTFPSFTILFLKLCIFLIILHLFFQAFLLHLPKGEASGSDEKKTTLNYLYNFWTLNTMLKKVAVWSSFMPLLKSVDILPLTSVWVYWVQKCWDFQCIVILY